MKKEPRIRTWLLGATALSVVVSVPIGAQECDPHPLGNAWLEPVLDFVDGYLPTPPGFDACLENSGLLTLTSPSTIYYNTDAETGTIFLDPDASWEWLENISGSEFDFDDPLLLTLQLLHELFHAWDIHFGLYGWCWCSDDIPKDQWLVYFGTTLEMPYLCYELDVQRRAHDYLCEIIEDLQSTQPSLADLIGSLCAIVNAAADSYNGTLSYQDNHCSLGETFEEIGCETCN